MLHVCISFRKWLWFTKRIFMCSQCSTFFIKTRIREYCNCIVSICLMSYWIVMRLFDVIFLIVAWETVNPIGQTRLIPATSDGVSESAELRRVTVKPNRPNSADSGNLWWCSGISRVMTSDREPTYDSISPPVISCYCFFVRYI